MYLVTLAGKRAQEIVWDTEALSSVLQNKGVNMIELKDETVPDFQVERLKEEQKDTLVGRFIGCMEAVEDRTLGQQALQYGLQALLARDERK